MSADRENQSIGTIEVCYMDRAASATDVPGHLYPLQDKEWTLWRDVALRGSGFPVTQVLELAVPECADAADELIRAEHEVERTRAEALRVLRERMDEVEKQEHRALVMLARAVKNLQFPQPVKALVTDSKEVETFSAAYTRYLALQADFQHVFQRASIQISHAIHRVACLDRFREAVVWQNRHALHTALDVLLQVSPDVPLQTSKQRLHETLVANYLQRYCTKNDSIGFFGPIGWAKLVSSGEPITVYPGKQLLASRHVYFESWGIDALAEMLSKDPSLLPWVAPRMMPYAHLRGNVLHLPFTNPIKLSHNQAVILHECDGQQTAREIAFKVISNPSNDLKSEQGVYAILEQLRNARRILWRFEIPPEGVYPERVLRQLLARIEDESLRREKLGTLDTLEQARETIAQVAGNHELLDVALGDIETTFLSIAGTAATRGEGQAYAARTLVYEDCRRDGEVLLGPELVQALEQPLTLILRSARWLTYHFAAFFYEAFLEAYMEIVEETGSPVVDFANFWLWMQEQVFDDSAHYDETLIEMFQERWATILPFSEEQHRVQFASADLAPSIIAMFDAPGPGWHGARYHSPDILISAASPEAIKAGDYQIVLGELHVGMNTLQAALFAVQYPSPEDLLRYVALDLPDTRILPAFPKNNFPPSSRVRPYFITPKDIRLVFSADAVAPPQSSTLTTGSMVIEQVDGRLVVRTRDGSQSFEVIEVFAEFLMRHVYDCLKIFPPVKHRPRITIDRVVIARETWCFAPAEIAFVSEKDAVQRFLAVRRWVNEHHMPRFVFFKVPSEQKPCFLDFASPLSINTFAKMIRHNQEIGSPAGSIVLSEMLPAVEQSWLVDAEGQHYTSELRIVALDMRAPSSTYLEGVANA